MLRSSRAPLDHDLIKLNQIMITSLLFEHDLRTTRSVVVARKNRYPLFRIMSDLFKLSPTFVKKVERMILHLKCRDDISAELCLSLR